MVVVKIASGKTAPRRQCQFRGSCADPAAAVSFAGETDEKREKESESKRERMGKVAEHPPPPGISGRDNFRTTTNLALTLRETAKNRRVGAATSSRTQKKDVAEVKEQRREETGRKRLLCAPRTGSPEGRSRDNVKTCEFLKKFCQRIMNSMHLTETKKKMRDYVARMGENLICSRQITSAWRPR